MKARFGKLNLKRTFKMVAQLAGEHLPEILVGTGVASMLVGTGLAVKATVDAVHDVEEVEQETGEEMTKKDIVKREWPRFAISGLTIVGGAVSVCCGMKKQINKTGAAMTMLAGVISELQDHQDKVEELLGAEKAKEIRESIIADDISSKDLEYDPDAERKYPGEERCYDKLTGRIFYASQADIREAINKINWRMTRGGEPYASYNEYCNELNDRTRPNNLPEVQPLGDDLGWNPDWGMIEPRFTSKLDKHGHPCLCVYFATSPKYGYQNYR